MRRVAFFLTVIVFFLVGCTSDPLQLSDLKFDSEDSYNLVYNTKEALIANRVDTMFLIYGQSAESGNRSDTAEYYVYDSNGRVLERRQLCTLCSNIRYKYDSIGFLTERIYDTDYQEWNKMSYHFEPDSLLLHQYYYDLKDPVADSLTLEPFFHTQISFDKKGLVLEEKSGWYGEGYITKTVYKYNSSAQPISMKTTEHYSDSKEDEYGHRDYFYTKGKLDSVVSRLAVRYGGLPEPLKMYYDERGLCYRLIDNGHIINCVYKLRR
jgi:hypothetical protein